MRADLAVFDLDGTLVDTAPDLLDTTNVVLGARGVPPVAAEILRPHISRGARGMIIRSLSEAGLAMSEDEIGALHRDFISHYASRIDRLSRPFPEMLAGLDALDAAGVRLAVCTNKRESLARQLLDKLGLMSRFVALAGLDTFGVAKPDPRHLLRTIEAAGGTAARTVFVGDSEVDYETARNADVPIAGVTYGYSEVPMEALAPDRLLRPGDDVAAAVLGPSRSAPRRRLGGRPGPVRR